MDVWEDEAVTDDRNETSEVAKGSVGTTTVSSCLQQQKMRFFAEWTRATAV